MIHGTFSYDAKSGKILFKNGSGKRIGVMNLTLPGDPETEIGGYPTHCQHVQLWLDADDDGETPTIATADIAPKPFVLGEALARALCAPAYLPRKLRELQAKRAQNQGHHHAANNSYGNPGYKFFPGRTLIEALAHHWRSRSTDILIGWAYIAVLFLTVFVAKNAIWIGLILLYPLWLSLGETLGATILKWRQTQQKIIVRHWHNGRLQKAIKLYIARPKKQ